METITLEPIRIFFCNINAEMGLKGHCHYAEVIIEWETIGEIGYPSFAHTNKEVRDFVQGLELKGIKGTNEQVLRYIWDSLGNIDFEECEKYNGKFRLYSLTLKVMGVKDSNNHDDGFTTYKKTAR